MAEQIPHRPRNGLWLQGLALTAQVALELEDADAARALYPLLRPYAGQFITMNMEQPVACLGSASLYLGLLATATRPRWDEAVEHFEASLREHERLGAAPFLARTRYAYARMLLRRGEAADRDRALRSAEPRDVHGGGARDGAGRRRDRAAAGSRHSRERRTAR